MKRKIGAKIRKIFLGGDYVDTQNKFNDYRKKIVSSAAIFKYIYIFKYERLLRRNSCSIPIKAEIGEHSTFPHFSGIFISEMAKIGNNNVIFQQVTIGSNTLQDSKQCGAPIIGNNCIIGAGAKIIGNIRIGDNVRIGANCVVISDIPDNATVVLEKPKIIAHTEPRNNEFISITECEKAFRP